MGDISFRLTEGRDGMAMLLESRDGNTGSRVMNTKKYVAMIAERMSPDHLEENNEAQ